MRLQYQWVLETSLFCLELEDIEKDKQIQTKVSCAQFQ